DTFLDLDHDALSYSATLTSGDALPAWLSFNSATHTFSGNPEPSDASPIQIRVTATDPDGKTVTDDFQLTLDNVADNHAPTDIALSNSRVAETQPAGPVVGSFSTTDPDSGDSHTYTLVSGTGSTDNGSFTIDASGHLKTAASFDYETKNSYSVRVRSTDAGGLWTEKAFTISVTNVNEAPTLAPPAPQTAYEDVDLIFTGVNRITVGDPDGGSLTVSLAVSHGTLTLGTTAGLTFAA